MACLTEVCKTFLNKFDVQLQMAFWLLIAVGTVVNKSTASGLQPIKPGFRLYFAYALPGLVVVLVITSKG